MTLEDILNLFFERRSHVYSHKAKIAELCAERDNLKEELSILKANFEKLKTATDNLISAQNALCAAARDLQEENSILRSAVAVRMMEGGIQ